MTMSAIRRRVTTMSRGIQDSRVDPTTCDKIQELTPLLVSAQFDEGATNALGLAGVSINGVATTLGAADANGNVPVTSNGPVNPGGNCSVMPIIMSLCWTNVNGQYVYPGTGAVTNNCPGIPLGLLEGYEIVERHSEWNSYGADLYRPAEFSWYAMTCLNCPTNWWAGTGVRTRTTETFQLACPLTNNVVWTYADQGTNDCEWANPWYTYVCVQDPQGLQLGLTTFTNGTQSALQPARGLAFGGQEERSDYALGGIYSGVQGSFFNGWGATNSVMKFRAPLHYPPDTPVIFTLEGVGCNAALSNITLWGQSPVAWSTGVTATVSYLLPMSGGQTYTIEETAFDWPTDNSSWCTNYAAGESPPNTDISNECHTVTAHTLSFTGFHNNDAPHFLTDVDDDGVIKDTAVENPTPGAVPSDRLLIQGGMAEAVFSNDVQEVTIAGERPTNGKAWLTYDSNFIKVYKELACTTLLESGSVSAPTWPNLTAVEPLPEKVYVKALKVTEPDVKTPLALYVGGDAVPASTLNIVIADKVGDQAFFRCVRDYLVEKQKRVCIREVWAQGGFPESGPNAKADFILCAWRPEKSTMTKEKGKGVTSHYSGIDIGRLAC